MNAEPNKVNVVVTIGQGFRSNGVLNIPSTNKQFLFNNVDLDTNREEMAQKVIDELLKLSTIMTSNQKKLKDSLVFVINPNKEPWSNNNVDLRQALFNANKALLPLKERRDAPYYAVEMVAVVLTKADPALAPKDAFQQFDQLLASTNAAMNNQILPKSAPSVADDEEEISGNSTRTRTSVQYVVPGTSYQPKGTNKRGATEYTNSFNLPPTSSGAVARPYWTSVVLNSNLTNLAEAVCGEGLENLTCRGRNLVYSQTSDISSLDTCPTVTLYIKDRNETPNDQQLDKVALSKNVLKIVGENSNNTPSVSDNGDELIAIFATYTTIEKTTVYRYHSYYGKITGGVSEYREKVRKEKQDNSLKSKPDSSSLVANKMDEHLDSTAYYLPITTNDTIISQENDTYLNLCKDFNTLQSGLNKNLKIKCENLNNKRLPKSNLALSTQGFRMNNLGIPLDERPTQLTIEGLVFNDNGIVVRPLETETLLRIMAEHSTILSSIVGNTFGVEATGCTARIKRGFDNTGLSYLLPSNKLWDKINEYKSYSTFITLRNINNGFNMLLSRELAKRGINATQWNRIAERAFAADRGIIWLKSDSILESLNNKDASSFIKENPMIAKAMVANVIEKAGLVMTNKYTEQLLVQNRDNLQFDSKNTVIIKISNKEVVLYIDFDYRLDQNQKQEIKKVLTELSRGAKCLNSDNNPNFRNCFHIFRFATRNNGNPQILNLNTIPPYLLEGYAKSIEQITVSLGGIQNNETTPDLFEKVTLNNIGDYARRN